jgi:hypothetical protein
MFKILSNEVLDSSKSVSSKDCEIMVENFQTIEKSTTRICSAITTIVHSSSFIVEFFSVKEVFLSSYAYEESMVPCNNITAVL